MYDDDVITKFVNFTPVTICSEQPRLFSPMSSEDVMVIMSEEFRLLRKVKFGTTSDLFAYVGRCYDNNVRGAPIGKVIVYNVNNRCHPKLYGNLNQASKVDMFNQLKYFAGAKPGLKRKQNQSEVTDTIKNAKRWQKYEETRPDRKFQESWKQSRPWLCYENGVMTCSVCVKNHGQRQASGSITVGNLKGKNAFIEGSTNLKLSTITDHEHSKLHVNCVESSKAKVSTPEEVVQSKSGQALMSLKAAERHRLAHLFRNAHAVGKRGRPLQDYTWLCQCSEANGIDIGNTYVNEKAAVVFLSYIAEAARKKTLGHIRKATYFSLLMDGSTDLAGDEQESIYVRVSQHGIVTETFMKIGSPESTCSKDLHEFVDNFLVENNLEKEKMIGLGSDGASNMVGVKSGLSTLLRGDIGDHFINVHCFNHRLELSFRDTVKNVKHYEKLMTLLIGLHYFYRKQYKNKKGLMNTFKALDTKSSMPPKVTGTRWLPHLTNGISSLLKCFLVYESHLSTISHGNAKAEGLVKMMLQKNMVVFVLFLQELLDPLVRLSKKLQQKNVTLADALIWTESTVELVREMETRDFKTLSEVIASGQYRGIDLHGNTPTMSYKSDLISGICEAITSRFKLGSEERSIVNATKVLNLQSWPVHDMDSFQDYGEEEITLAATFYEKLVEEEEFATATVREWKMLKKVLHKRHGSRLQTLSWGELYTDEADFQKIYLLVDLLQTLPPTSVSCETSFSHMKLIKTCRRLNLREDTTNTLMTVKLSTPEINMFDPEAAIDEWLGDGLRPRSKRRPNYHRRPKATTVENAGDEDDSDSEDDLLNATSLESEIDEFDFQDERTNDRNIVLYTC